MSGTGTAAEYLPSGLSLTGLREAARTCKACPLWRNGTQTVFGEGRKVARLFFVGEQPGDREDLEGSPFVGPAGRLLDDALEEAGIDRADAYVTNAVKHFKWEPRRKRRIHQKPNAAEIAACRPWLDAELAVVKPRVLVCLGASAAQALLGRGVRVTRDRGRSNRSSQRLCSRQCIRRRSCVLRTRSRGNASELCSSTTSGSPQRRYVKG